MTTILTIFLIFFAIALTFFVLPAIVLLATSIIWNDAPFVPVPWRAVPGIVEALALDERSVVYDMGCGDARVLCAAVRSRPGIRAVGIECAFLPYVLARIRSRGLPIEIRKKNFFDEDLGEATHVVTYLFPEVMEKIEEKLAQELKPGTHIIAVDFPLSTMKPIKVIQQKVPGLKRGSTLSIYQL